MQLFPHQVEATNWLALQKRAGLFDEQGLGKTAAAITAAARIGGRCLVIAPTVVAHNWAREIGLWAPGDPVQVITSGRTQVDPAARWVVTTHGLLRVLAPRLRAMRATVLVVDEAHAFKSPQAKRTQALYGARRTPGLVHGIPHVWLLTGTPMPNNPVELWTHLAALVPERILAPGTTARALTWTEFRDRFCVLARSAFTPDGVKVVGAKNAEELRARMKGFALRRRKREVLNLPPMRWGTMTITGGRLPAALESLEAELAGKPVEALAESVHFSTWRRLCGLAKAEPAVELLAEELEADPGHRVVVFAHHAEVIDLLTRGLAKFGVVRITGGQTASDRQAAVLGFQSRGSVRVAVANIVAGGVGVTLTAAHDVVFVEQSWVPGENAQAADRCHRIGQQESVLVRVLALAGSIDEKIADTLATKSQMIREVIR